MSRERKPLPALDNASTIKNPDLPDIYNKNYTDTILKYGGLATRYPQLNTNAKTVVAAINELYASGDETKHRTLTQAEYDALSPEEKNNGTIYFVSDAGGGGGGASSLSELTDVNLQELYPYQVLTYNGEYWVNSISPVQFDNEDTLRGRILWYDGFEWRPSYNFLIDLEYRPYPNQMLYFNDSNSTWSYIDAPLVTDVNASINSPESGAVLYYDGFQWTAKDAIRFNHVHYEDRQLLLYDASSGLWVNTDISNAIQFNELGGIDIDRPADGDVLMYSSGGWKNTVFHAPEYLENLHDVAISSPNDGQVLKYFDGQWINANESGGGSTVSVTQIQSTGTKIATVTVDAVDTDLYAPNPGSTVTVTPVQSTGTKIATITVDSSPSDLYAPSGVSSVNVSQIQTVGTKIATITVDGSGTDLYAPTSGGSSTLAGLSDVTLTSPTNNQVLKYDSTNNMWVNAADSGVSSVTVTQVQSTGTKIATVNVDGTSTDLYTPTGVSSVAVNQIQTTGTKIATVTVDSVATDLYAPTGGGASSFAGLSDVSIDTLTLATGQVPIYNSVSQKWENGTTSGGHTIVDDSGTSLTQRTNLQFNGAYSEDNSTDDTTEVNVVREMTKAEFEQLTPAEQVGFINITDITGGNDDRFQPIIYSEEEREIGVWTDGKPLYEKAIYCDVFPNSTSKNLSTPPNIDALIDVGGFMKSKTLTGYFRTLPFAAGGSNDVRVDLNGGTLRVVTFSDWSSYDGYIIVRYTKTTDAAGSGQWTPQGVPAHHYSTNEKVVGTWIDGKTLYEKTVVIQSLPSSASLVDYPHNISNIDTICTSWGHVRWASGSIAPLNTMQFDNGYALPAASFFYLVSKTNISIAVGMDRSSTSATITLQYTKTSI